jgi:NAD-dependent histone deacetylase SIR2
MDIDGASDLSSELSSIASLSPPPPDFDIDRYPTPPLSQVPDGCSTPSDQSEVTNTVDDMHPARKRRKTEPKPRTTQYLDLKGTSSQADSQKDPLALLIKTLRKRRKIVVIAGAGISVSAGSESARLRNLLLKFSNLTRCRSPRFPFIKWSFQVLEI